ncbi:MAG TPA: winged helix-turn-helix domain-containing protein, partial [Elainellaceae cyanobacterium]
PHAPETFILNAGNLVLDLRQRSVNMQGNAIDLSTREFTLLEMLVREPGRVWTRQELLDQVWGYDYESSSNIIDVYIGYLRKKLGQGTIKTVRGAGYRLQL